MAIRLATVAECECTQFLPIRTSRAAWLRRRDDATNDILYVVVFQREGRESEVTTPDYVRAKRQYEFWRDMVRSI